MCFGIICFELLPDSFHDRADRSRSFTTLCCDVLLGGTLKDCRCHLCCRTLWVQPVRAAAGKAFTLKVSYKT